MTDRVWSLGQLIHAARATELPDLGRRHKKPSLAPPPLLDFFRLPLRARTEPLVNFRNFSHILPIPAIQAKPVGNTVAVFGRAVPVNEATLQGQITEVRSRIEVLKLALPGSIMDDRAFASVGTQLRSKSAELDALKADLKRIKIKARVEVSLIPRLPRRNSKAQRSLGRAIFRRAAATRSK